MNGLAWVVLLQTVVMIVVGVPSVLAYRRDMKRHEEFNARILNEITAIMKQYPLHAHVGSFIIYPSGTTEPRIDEIEGEDP
jgi:hypothetical protein